NKSGPADQNGKIAKLTQIVGSAQPNGTDRMFFDNGTSTTPIATNPFGGTSNSSDRGWADKTVDVTSLMPGSLDHVNPMYGESVTTTVDHTNISPYDCLSWGAIVFSTTEADVDSDGLPDGLEDAPGGLRDAGASPLPNLNAMTASSSHPDIFIEMTGMWTPPADPPGTSGGFPGTTYGSSSAPYKSTIAPYSPTLDSVTDTAGHNHLPTPEVIKALAQHFATSSFTSLNGTVYTGVVPHIDVGTRASYKQALNLQDADVAAITTYLVPDDDARGGDHDGLQETPCGLLSAADCTASPPWYKDYPGTVGWQVGYEKYALNYFDKNRNGLFHWLFYAHANGWPRSPLPCLDSGLM